MFGTIGSLGWHDAAFQPSHHHFIQHAEFHDNLTARSLYLFQIQCGLGIDIFGFSIQMGYRADESHSS